MALTSYANELLLNFLFNTDSVTRPTAWFVAWHIGPPGDDGSANEQAVGGDADYARQPVTFGAASWSGITRKSILFNTNTVSITPATGTDYTIYGFSIWDSLTGGNCLASVDSKAAVPVSDIAPLLLIAGKIPVSLSRENSLFGRTSYGGNLTLDWGFTTELVIRPTLWYIGLHTAEPGDDGSSNEVTAGDDPDYVRKATAFDTAATFTGSDSYTMNNINSIWTPGSGANFTAPYVVVWDSLSGGNALYIAACVPERVGIEAQTVSVGSNELMITERV